MPVRFPRVRSGTGTCYPVPRLDQPGLPWRKLPFGVQGSWPGDPCAMHLACWRCMHAWPGFREYDVISWPFDGLFAPSSLYCQGRRGIGAHTGFPGFGCCALRPEAGGTNGSFPACAFGGRSATIWFIAWVLFYHISYISASIRLYFPYGFFWGASFVQAFCRGYGHFPGRYKFVPQRVWRCHAFAGM